MSNTHPSYYGKLFEDYELIDYMLTKDPEFSRLIALKYILRADKKGSYREDLEKAKYYLKYIPKKDAVEVLEKNCELVNYTKDQLVNYIDNLLDSDVKSK